MVKKLAPIFVGILAVIAANVLDAAWFWYLPGIVVALIGLAIAGSSLAGADRSGQGMFNGGAGGDS